MMSLTKLFLVLPSRRPAADLALPFVQVTELLNEASITTHGLRHQVAAPRFSNAGRFILEKLTDRRFVACQQQSFKLFFRQKPRAGFQRESLRIGQQAQTLGTSDWTNSAGSLECLPEYSGIHGHEFPNNFRNVRLPFGLEVARTAKIAPYAIRPITEAAWIHCLR